MFHRVMALRISGSQHALIEKDERQTSTPAICDHFFGRKMEKEIMTNITF